MSNQQPWSVTWNQKDVLATAKGRVNAVVGGVADILAQSVKQSITTGGLRDTGFMADHVISLRAGDQGVSAVTEIREGKMREAEAVAPPPDGMALVASAATHTMYVEIRFGFFWSTVLRAANQPIVVHDPF